MKKNNLPLIFNGLVVKKKEDEPSKLYVKCRALQTKNLELDIYYKNISNIKKYEG